MDSILVTGAGGLVGGKIVQRLLETEISFVHAVYHSQLDNTVNNRERIRKHILDLTNTNEVARLITTIKPQLVIHAAAMTNVDACEYNRELAYASNVTCTESIAQACAAIGAQLIYISTDYVFDGSNEQPGPYSETAPIHPINYYGLTKFKGEESVQKYCEAKTKWAICRSSVIYGSTLGSRLNFVLWLVKELRVGHTVRVVKDQFSTPTLVDHLVTIVIEIGLQEGKGVYHTAGADFIDRLSFAKQVANAFALDTSLLEPITTASLQQYAPRPLRCGLLCHRIIDELGIKLLSTHSGIDILRSQLTT